METKKPFLMQKEAITDGEIRFRTRHHRVLNKCPLDKK